MVGEKRVIPRKETGSYKFLTKNEAENALDYWENLTCRIVNIGDAGLRKQTRIDKQTIGTVISSLALTEDEAGAEWGLNELKGIIQGGGKHSLLAKTWATVSYCDLAFKFDSWDKKGETFFKEVVRTEPELGGGVILAGAFWARAMFNIMDKKDGKEALEMIEAIEKGWWQNTRTAAEERRMIGVQVAKRVIGSMLQEDVLEMVFPISVIYTREPESGEPELGVAGYPDSVMYLGQGYLPTFRKLRQAARWGVPEMSNKLLEPRMVRVLAGVEIDEVSETAKMSGRIRAMSGRKLVHIYLRALRRSMEEAKVAFRDQYGGDKRAILRHGSFDSLSLWVATQVSREIKKEFGQIDESGARRGERNRRKEEIVERKLKNWRKKLMQLEDRYFGDEDETSIIEIALEESYRAGDGELGWDALDVLDHIQATARALAIETQGRELKRRTPQEIAGIYREHIWEKELTEEDKLELARVLLESQHKRFWEKLGDLNVETAVVEWVHHGHILGSDIKRAVLVVMDELKEEILILRWETIRNKREPESWAFEEMGE